MKHTGRLAAVVALVPASLVVLLGAGIADTEASATATVAGALPSASAEGALGGGCTVPDPSGTGGCVTPTLAALMAQVQQRFGRLPVSCWSPRSGDPYSDHPKGMACDYTMGRIGSYPGPADVRLGWSLATWLRANNQALGVNYVIWQGRIWSRAHDAEGWRPYTGGGYYAFTGPTNGHYDHVHVSTIR